MQRVSSTRTVIDAPDTEPTGEWYVESVPQIVNRFHRADGSVKPVVVGLDGRSGSGKSTIADALSAQSATAWVVHTDDVAWNLSFFDWAEHLVDGILSPVRENTNGVSYRPRSWDAHGREGSISVPDDAELLIVEGVGVGRRELAPWLDGVVWVQSDTVAAKRATLLREGDSAEAESFWNEWQAEEDPFLYHQRPWERATFMIAGTGAVHAPALEPNSFAVADLL